MLNYLLSQGFFGMHFDVQHQKQKQDCAWISSCEQSYLNARNDGCLRKALIDEEQNDQTRFDQRILPSVNWTGLL